MCDRMKRTMTTGIPINESSLRHSSLCWLVTLTVRLENLSTSSAVPISFASSPPSFASSRLSNRFESYETRRASGFATIGKPDIDSPPPSSTLAVSRQTRTPAWSRFQRFWLFCRRAPSDDWWSLQLRWWAARRPSGARRWGIGRLTWKHLSQLCDRRASWCRAL